MNFTEYKSCLESDAKSMQVDTSTFIKRTKVYYRNTEWRFIRRLRRVEYFKDKKGLLNRVLYFLFYYRYRSLGIKLGFSIPLNVLGPGLSLPHRGTIVISDKAKIGSNARIHVCVNIGASKGGSPVIGDNVYIGPGAKIFGPIKIGNNVQIGANAVVNQSFEEDNIVIAGIPAKVVKRI